MTSSNIRWGKNEIAYTGIKMIGKFIFISENRLLLLIQEIAYTGIKMIGKCIMPKKSIAYRGNCLYRILLIQEVDCTAF